jgi:uncharacterized repeat protein (TIGR01451 family)
MKKIYFLLVALCFCLGINAQSAPIAVNDVLLQPLIEDGADGTINILLNDTDPDGNPTPTSGHLVDLDLSFSGIQNSYSFSGYVSNYSVFYDVNSGVITINPGANVYGNFSFQYALIDNVNPNLSSIATVSFSVTSVIDPVTANNDSIGYSLNSCNQNQFSYYILSNDFAEDGINSGTIDLNPTLSGIQSEIDINNQYYNLHISSSSNGQIYIFGFGSSYYYYNPPPPASFNYTFQDSLGVTSNIGTVTINFYTPFGNIFKTNPTCENQNNGSIAFYTSGSDFSFNLYKNGVFYNQYSGSNQLTISGLSAGQYEVQGGCGIPWDWTLPIILNIANPFIGTGSGIYVDYNNDGIVNVGDVVNQQYTVTNTSNICSFTNIKLDNYYNDVNLTSQPILSIAANETISNAVTATKVITQNDINNGFVETQKYFIADVGITAPASNNSTDFIIINTPLNVSNGIKLNAFIDSNGNGFQDNNEQNFTYGNFTYNINGGVVHNINSSSGNHYLYETNPTNSYSIAYSINSQIANQYTIATSNYSNVTVANGSGVTTYNFALTPIPYNDVEVLLLPISQPRPGFTYQTKIAIRNNGNQIVNTGTINFTKDNNVTISSVSETVTTTATGFTLNFYDLYPYETRYIFVSMLVPTIPNVTLGQLLVNNTTITLPTVDNVISNNSTTLSQTIVGSYDPNEKSESHGGKILHSSFSANDYLTYTIQFENTGTSEAINIKVVDILDPKLDETTVKMFSSTDGYVLDRVGRNLTWKFNGINLPPSNGSTTAGHGSITFQVKPKVGFAVGDIIPNIANIYFDFNPAIITPTCLTLFVSSLNVQDFVFSNYFSLFPNPVENVLNISSKENIEISSVNIYNTLGQLVLVIPNAQNTKTIDVSSLTSGNYFIKINSDKGTSNTKFIKK